MLKAERAMWAYGDTEVAEMDSVTGSIYLGDPGVDSLNCILYFISSNLITQQITHSVFSIC